MVGFLSFLNNLRLDFVREIKYIVFVSFFSKIKIYSSDI